MRPYILAETNWKTVKNTNYQLAILPWGATEAHNYHLPYSTDNFEAEAVAVGAAKVAWEKGVKVIVLPVIPFGVNTGQHDIKLDMNLNPSTQFAILNDVIETLNRQGIYKFVILNSHGGNDFRQMLRELGLKYPKMFLSQIDWYKIKEQEELFDDLGEHAGEVETSMMLFLKPELVLPLDEAGNGAAKRFRFKGIQEGWAWAERKWSMVTADTGIGDPAKATAKKGKHFYELICQKIGDYLFELSEAETDDWYE
ncbi:MAG: amidase [Bacteroidetes bacterium GWF2_42_66]|nr:MAG: amidase [Bacteroidetes bacterium GWA2_42_15]OFY00268.1 MAG: amidase [Bacteroidetes bacterium GWE2_42_39]OFY47161.1 MAG: amidase [Bacteroidetes bacterium GWF2_42_66]HBL76648.1 amidase [Prolixibacteraceae bacterium]HCR89821.1 amidase [Prolixibacteraceae bacterium]